MSPGSQLHFSSRHLGLETQQDLDSRNPDELSLNSFTSISLCTKEPAGQMSSSRSPGGKGLWLLFLLPWSSLLPRQGQAGVGWEAETGVGRELCSWTFQPCSCYKNKKSSQHLPFFLLTTRAFDGGIRFLWASLVAQMVKNLPAMQETRVLSLGTEDPWRRTWQSTLVFLSGEFHGQRSLVSYSPWGR